MKYELIAITLGLALAIPAYAVNDTSVDFGYGQKVKHFEDGGGPKGSKKGAAHRKGKVPEKLKNMSKEERQAFRKETKEKWDALSVEEKEAFKLEAQKMMEARKKAQEERRLIRLYGLHLLEQQGN